MHSAAYSHIVIALLRYRHSHIAFARRCTTYTTCHARVTTTEVCRPARVSVSRKQIEGAVLGAAGRIDKI
jgi:hypothetical protein